MLTVTTIEIEIEIEMFAVRSMFTVRETVHYSLEEDFAIANTEPLELSAHTDKI